MTPVAENTTKAAHSMSVLQRQTLMTLLESGAHKYPVHASALACKLRVTENAVRIRMRRLIEQGYVETQGYGKGWLLRPAGSHVAMYIKNRKLA